MFDTLVFRIHDLKKHQALVHFLHKKHLEGLSTMTKELRDEAFNPVKEIRYRKYYIDHATGESYEGIYRNKIKSWETDLTYGISAQRDYIEFNFSMPKYLFGNNVMQLVPHYNDVAYGYFRQHEFDSPQLIQYHFMMLKATLDNWVAREFGGLEIDFKQFEWVRLDLAFNLVFKSVTDVEVYLNMLKSVKKKYQKEYGQKHNYYDSSIYFPASAETFKIYHKGPEFRAVHDGKPSNYSAYQKRHPGKGADLLNEVANRTLRYEVEFRPEAMSRVWWEHSAKRIWREYLIRYRHWNTEGWVKWQGVIYGFGPGMIATMPKELKSVLEAGKKLDRKISYYRDSDEQYRSVHEFSHKVPLDYKMISGMIKRFSALIDPFYVRRNVELQFIGHSVSYLNERNERVEVALKGLNIERVRFIANALRHGQGWKELENEAIMSRRQFYRYKKFFYSVGFGDMNSDVHSIGDVDFTYARYYDELYPIWNLVAPSKQLPFRL